MNAEEFDDWLRPARDRYARHLADNDGYPPDMAAARAQREFAELLPEGLHSAGHSLYTIEADRKAAGTLWLGEREQAPARSIFVYAVYVNEERRGYGLGRAAMQFTETQARKRGIRRVSLNVFGDNDVARSMYRALGYRESSVSMTKDL
jgi:ribosomal protein S18 acetylase RimI-like enzyme